MWLRDSWNHYDKVAHSAEADSAGIQISPGVMFQNTSSPVSVIPHYKKEVMPLLQLISINY